MQSFDCIESGMTLLGATGVENQLQEDVPETLEALLPPESIYGVLTG